MNIVLIGMRGSWKSSVGKILAQRLGFGLRETDAMVEERTGQPIADLVRQHGWGVFREKEAEAVAEVKAPVETVAETSAPEIVEAPVEEIPVAMVDETPAQTPAPEVASE